jgi:hypothetical protein
LISCSTFLLLLHHLVSFFCQGFFQSVWVTPDSFDVLDFQVDQMSSHMQRRLSILLFPIKLTIHGPVWMFLAEETTVPLLT